jgi:hypothetical protein
LATRAVRFGEIGGKMGGRGGGLIHGIELGGGSVHFWSETKVETVVSAT